LNLQFFRRAYEFGAVREPMLEIGSSKVLPDLPNLCEMARSFNIRDAIGVDIEIGNGVDVIHDFRTAPPYSMRQAYSTVCIFNVLEHTFDPVTILRNALECTRLGGSLVVSTPANWPIHNYPKDYCRLLPDWYETFADQNGLDVIEELFLWQTEFGLIPVRNVRSSNR